jgi:hypothetical protein
MNGDLRAYRSMLRTFLVLAAGALLMLAAVDVVAAHVVSSPPETDATTGALTSRGQNQRRSDMTWGWSLMLIGGTLVIASAGSAVARRPVLEVRADSLRVRVAGPRRFLTIPYDDVTWVHSAADGDDEVVPPRVLLIHVRSASDYPEPLWGAEWDGNTLVVDADSWSRRPEEVATRVDLALDAWRRRAQALEAEEAE